MCQYDGASAVSQGLEKDEPSAALTCTEPTLQQGRLLWPTVEIQFCKGWRQKQLVLRRKLEF